MRKIFGIASCLALLLATGACDKQERAHEVHLRKGAYAGKPGPKLDAQQVSALERRANYEKD